MTEHAEVTGKEIIDFAEKDFPGNTISEVEQHLYQYHHVASSLTEPDWWVEMARHLKALSEGKVSRTELVKE